MIVPKGLAQKMGKLKLLGLTENYRNSSAVGRISKILFSFCLVSFEGFKLLLMEEISSHQRLLVTCSNFITSSLLQ